MIQRRKEDAKSLGYFKFIKEIIGLHRNSLSKIMLMSGEELKARDDSFMLQS